MNIQDHIIYRDAMIIALNKPAGIAVHPSTGKMSSLDLYFDDLKFGLPARPELAHRLDAATSGCLILGRHRQALNRLRVLFQLARIDKTYWAITQGIPKEKEGIIDLPLGKQEQAKYRWWMKVDHEHGKPSVTHYKVLGTFQDNAWLELTPKTGRTHQLRVHCAAMGWPVMGEYIYAEPSDGEAQGLHLLCRQMQVPIYPKKDPIILTAEAPAFMQEMLDKMK
jgi:tRNA pseudouridine32 synthase / 23S rRNA pseudouridine746 synthase